MHMTVKELQSLPDRTRVRSLTSTYVYIKTRRSSRGRRLFSPRLLGYSGGCSCRGPCELRRGRVMAWSSKIKEPPAWKDGGTVTDWMMVHYSTTVMKIVENGVVVAGPCKMDDMPPGVVPPFWFRRCHAKRGADGVYTLEIIPESEGAGKKK